ncbi:hypothetical protein V8E53_013897, partial [Lactarius tabidus]
MVTALATLTRLRDLRIGFRSPVSRPNRIHLPPPIRTILPALTFFEFRGVREYLENFVAQIAAPRLDSIFIDYFNQFVDFEVPQLWQFIDNSEDLNRPMHGSVQFHPKRVSFGAGPTTHIPESESFDDFPQNINVRIRCEGMDWQISHIAQALSQISAVFSNMLHLAINSDEIGPEPEVMDDIEWLQLLRSFPSVQTLFVSREYARHLSRSLEDIPVVAATDVLPALDLVCFEDQPVTSVHKLIAARWKSGRPVATVDTRLQFDERLLSYL